MCLKKFPYQCFHFHKESNYGYHFIKKEQKNFFKNLLVWEKIQKKKKKEKDKNGGETIKNISYILQFLDSIGFIASSLTNLVNNLSVGIQTKKCLSL